MTSESGDSRYRLETVTCPQRCWNGQLRLFFRELSLVIDEFAVLGNEPEGHGISVPITNVSSV